MGDERRCDPVEGDKKELKVFVGRMVDLGSWF